MTEGQVITNIDTAIPLIADVIFIIPGNVGWDKEGEQLGFPPVEPRYSSVIA